MDFEDYLRFGLALILVLGLIGLAAYLARRLGLAGATPIKRSRNRRLAVVETAALDAKRRLVLVRRDGSEHLLLLGPAGDAVVEQGIHVEEPAAAPAPQTGVIRPGERP